MAQLISRNGQPSQSNLLIFFFETEGCNKKILYRFEYNQGHEMCFLMTNRNDRDTFDKNYNVFLI